MRHNRNAEYATQGMTTKLRQLATLNGLLFLISTILIRQQLRLQKEKNKFGGKKRAFFVIIFRFPFVYFASEKNVNQLIKLCNIENIIQICFEKYDL